METGEQSVKSLGSDIYVLTTPDYIALINTGTKSIDFLPVLGLNDTIKINNGAAEAMVVEGGKIGYSQADGWSLYALKKVGESLQSLDGTLNNHPSLKGMLEAIINSLENPPK